jgi:ACS family D-galactonate transporter-like MFS transporter
MRERQITAGHLVTDAPGTVTPLETKHSVLRPWLVVGLLFLFMVINYADRAVLGLAAEPLMRELGLTPSQFGKVGSAFFFFYCLSGIVLGFVINRVETRWMLFVLVLIWSAAQFPMIAMGNYAVLLVSRMLLGIGEGPAYPAAIHSAFRWFPDEKRALPSALITQGSAVGVIIAAPTLSWVIVNFGWQTAFVALGFTGLIWAACWLAFATEGPITRTVTAEGATLRTVPYSRLLLNPTVLGTWFMVFAAYWALSILLVWFPTFLRAGLGFTPGQAGAWTTLPWAGGVVAILSVGWASQKLMQKGFSSRISRVVLLCVVALVGAGCLLSVALVTSVAAKLIIATLGVVLPNAVVAPAQAILGEIAPVRQRGAVLSIGNAVAATSGMIAPYATGLLIEHAPTALQGYEAAFWLCGIVVCVANLLGLVLIRPDVDGAKLAALQKV